MSNKKIEKTALEKQQTREMWGWLIFFAFVSVFLMYALYVDGLDKL